MHMFLAALALPWASAHVPIKGTWMYDRSSAMEWDTALTEFKSVGGTTVLAFGNALIRVTADEARSDPKLAECVVGGIHCVDYATQAIIASGALVGEVLTLTATTQYAPAVLTPCADAGIGEVHLPPLNNASRLSEFWTLVLPRNRSTTNTSRGKLQCEMSSGWVVDVVLVVLPLAKYTPSPKDGTRLRVEAAARNGIDIYLPMVALPPQRMSPWQVDAAAAPAFFGLLSREIKDICIRFSENMSVIRGFYQSHETLISGSAFWVTQYDFYNRTAQVIHDHNPLLRLVVSPYWIVNKADPSNQTMAATAEGLVALAATDIDALAPQEGRGTGKCGVYSTNETTSRIREVDPNLARYKNINGLATFGDQFWASTSQLYAASRHVVDRENARRQRRQLELWMNLEAFEETSVNVCNTANSNDRTNASRVQRSWALANESAAIDFLISFMWDPYFTCIPAGYQKSLYQEIAASARKPMVTLTTKPNMQ